MTASADRLPTRSRWRARLHEVIFEADTPAGRGFDVGLLIAILVSVIVVMLESVADVRREYGVVFRAVEWTLTIAFTVEYALRLVSVDRPWRYARSFFGFVDLLAIAPTYLALVAPEAHSLMVIRAIRLLRVAAVRSPRGTDHTRRKCPCRWTGEEIGDPTRRRGCPLARPPAR